MIKGSQYIILALSTEDLVIFRTSRRITALHSDASERKRQILIDASHDPIVGAEIEKLAEKYG